MNKFCFRFYQNEAKWHPVGAICRSLQRTHRNDNLKWKPPISSYREERAFAKPAFDCCRDLYVPQQLLVLPSHPHLHFTEISSDTLHQVWYYFFFPDQCTQLLVFQVPSQQTQSKTWSGPCKDSCRYFFFPFLKRTWPKDGLGSQTITYFLLNYLSFCS